MTTTEMAPDCNSETSKKEFEKLETWSGGEHEGLEDPCRAGAQGPSGPKPRILLLHQNFFLKRVLLGFNKYLENENYSFCRLEFTYDYYYK